MTPPTGGLAVASIARVCHEANRAYCITQGDHSQPRWDEAPDWQRNSAVDGVEAILEGRVRSAEDSHINWLRDKFAAGWVYGPVKDPEKKEHPCCVTYDQLPVEQRRKDALFFAIVTALKGA